MNPRHPFRLAVLAALGGALAVACSNAGETRVLSIPGAGLVDVVVYFDRNGDRVPNAGDTGLTGVGVRLVLVGSHDTVARGTSLADGSLRLPDVPVGSYVVSVDTTTFGTDSFRLTRVDPSLIDVTPGDSLLVRIAISYPQVTVRQARALAPGKKVFVVGVALNDGIAFGDSTVHLADTSGAVRLTILAPSAVFARDSIRILGTRSVDGFGLPVFSQVSIETLNLNAAVAPRALSTLLAADADTGRADAALVKVSNAVIGDTATVPGGRRLEVTDGSDTLEVRLDSIPGFTPAYLAANPGVDTVGATICATGVLVPASPGVWRLKPRSPSDILAKAAPGCP